MLLSKVSYVHVWLLVSTNNYIYFCKEITYVFILVLYILVDIFITFLSHWAVMCVHVYMCVCVC